MPDVTPDRIMKIAMGFMAAKHLFAANEIGLFEGLAAGPANIAELATKTTIPPRTLAIVANAMVSLGLVDRQGDRYRNVLPEQSRQTAADPTILKAVAE